MSDARYEVITTALGAHALRDRESGEVMHPGLGPLHEAEQLYLGPSRLESRLAELSPDPLVLLDVGLGAGTNAIMALRAAEVAASPARRLEIVSFDLTCAAMAHVLASERRAAFGFTPELGRAADTLLSEGRYESARVSWRLVLGDALACLGRERACSADLVFWDLFSPRTDARLWSEAAFRVLRRVCRAGATVHTYSAATATRSALLLAGFYVGLGPAASVKQKHATFAATCREDVVRPLDSAWLASLRRADGAATSEPALSPEARTRLSALPQFARL